MIRLFMILLKYHLVCMVRMVRIKILSFLYHLVV